MTTFARVPFPEGDGSIVACWEHRLVMRRAFMAHSMPQARRMAAAWIEQCARLDPAVNPGVIFAAAIPDTLPFPPCCPAGGLARSNMMAAFRELTRGEG
jgi:hypothetical protein